MCFESAQEPSDSQNYEQALQAQVLYAPAIYKENAKYSPLYTQMGLSNLNSFLNGTNGNNGFLSEYANQVMPALTQAETTANTAIRTANLNDAAALTPQYIAEENAANPMAAGLLGTLNSNATRDLSYGTQLTPAEQVQMNQSVRGAQAARGMGFGPSDVFAETLADTGFGQQLYQQRQSEAQGQVQQDQSFYGNPTAAISGMGSNYGMTANSLASLGASGAAPAQSEEFNPSAMAMQNASLGTSLGEANAGIQNSGLSMGLGSVSSL